MSERPGDEHFDVDPVGVLEREVEPEHLTPDDLINIRKYQIVAKKRIKELNSKRKGHYLRRLPEEERNKLMDEYSLIDLLNKSSPKQENED